MAKLFLKHSAEVSDRPQVFEQILKNPVPLHDFITMQGLKVSDAYAYTHCREGTVALNEVSSVWVHDHDEVVMAQKVQGEGFTKTLRIVGYITNPVGTFLGDQLWDWAMDSLTPSFGGLGTGGGGGGTNSSPTYGWDGVQTLSDVGVPVPVVYGKHIVGGNYIGAFTTNDNGVSTMNLLIAVGEGPFKSIAGIDSDTDSADLDTIGDKILIEGNAINNYDGVQVGIRLGTHNQTPFRGFSSIVDQYTLFSVQLEQNNGYTRDTQNSDTDEVRFGFQHNGLNTFNEEEGIQGGYVEVKFEYKVKGANDSTYVEYGDRYRYGDKTTSEQNNEYVLQLPSKNAWTIRVTKVTADTQVGERNTDTFLTYMNEVRDEQLAYPYTGLVYIKALATSQLNNSLGNIEIEVEGISNVPTWNGSTTVYEYSQNPIWCLSDIISNTRYGLGKYYEDPSDIVSLPENYADAQYMDDLVSVEGESNADTRFTMNVVIDDESPALDKLTQLGSAYFIAPVWEDGIIKLVADRDKSITQLFTMGNIIKDSYSLTHRDLTSQYNTYEIQFTDEDNRYKRDEAVVEDEADLANNPVRKSTVFLRGVTSREEVNRTGRIMLNKALFVSMVLSFSAATDAIACNVGDIVGFAHDVPQVGYISGRVASATASTVVLQQNVTLPPLSSGQSYEITVRHDDDTIETKTVTNVSGTYTAGQTLNISGTWSQTPTAGTVYSIGRNEISVKPYRVLSIVQEGDFTHKLTVEEHIADALDGTDNYVDDPEYTELPDPSLPPSQVTGLDAFSTASYTPIVLLSWRGPGISATQGFFEGCDVYMKRSGDSNWTFVSRSRGVSAEIPNLAPGQTYDFKAVAFSNVGVLADFNTAPTVSHTPTLAVPPKVTGLELVDQGNNTEFSGDDAHFTWRPVRSTSTASHPAGKEPGGAGAGTQDAFIDGYVVTIWDGVTYPSLDLTGATPVRSTFTRNNFYSYTRTGNEDDHNGNAQRSFAVTVNARDIYNQLGPGAVLTVQNPAPAAVSSASFRTYNAGTFGIFEWSSSADNDLLGYLVQRRDTDGVGNVTYTNKFFGLANTAGINDPLSGGFSGGGISYRVAPIDEFMEYSPSKTDYPEANWTTFILAP